jgi:hypothetical protein
MGLHNATQKIVADKLKMSYQKVPNLMAKRGEADRDKPLFAGKRKMGKATIVTLIYPPPIQKQQSKTPTNNQTPR